MANSGSGPRGVHKRDKVYCDKWVHEGICAFTQQGCRFKHEMPVDAEGLRNVGLFHGPPSWWIKLQKEQARPTTGDHEVDLPVSLNKKNGYGGQLRAEMEGQAASGGLTIGAPEQATAWVRQVSRDAARTAGTGNNTTVRQPETPTSNTGFQHQRVGKLPCYWPIISGSPLEDSLVCADTGDPTQPPSIEARPPPRRPSSRCARRSMSLDPSALRLAALSRP